MAEPDRDIYVGYLPTPERHARLLRFVLPLLVLGSIALGAVVAALLDRPGAAVWDTANVTTLRGVIRARPYAHLETDSGAVLLVGQGKHAPGASILAADGKVATLGGSLIERGSWAMLEIDPAQIQVDDAISASPSAELVDLGQIEAWGEILDGKCYLGAMKPGDGRAHRACAVLCLRGGIPPMFVGTTPDGEAIAAVLSGPGGGPMPESLIALVGEPVEVRGRIGRRGMLPVLRASEDAVRLR